MNKTKPSQLKAIRTYQSKNRKKISLRCRERYKTDEDYRERVKEANRRYYQRNKEKFSADEEYIKRRRQNSRKYYEKKQKNKAENFD